MLQTLQHSFLICRTEFSAQKNNCQLDGASLQLLDSTCLLNYPMNRNNIIEGNNIIYISGSYITFFNFFQNSKQFGSLVSNHRPVGMVGNNMGRGNIAVVTQKQDKSELYVSIYTFCQEFVPTHCIKKPLIFIDIVMLRTVYVIVAVMDLITKQNYVYVLNSKYSFVINFDDKIKRLIAQDQKVYVIFQDGGIYYLDTQKANVSQPIIIQHKQKNIDDYCLIQNQLQVILCSRSILYYNCFQPQKQWVLDLSKQLEGAQVYRIMKVGRNIFLVHKHSLTISHIFIGQQNLTFVVHHTYHQKLKANIISAQSSHDQMHAALAVQIFQKQEVKIQNFLFNLSGISKSHEYMSPFTRLVSTGADYGVCGPMQNVLSCNSYLLAGAKIVNLFHSTVFQRKKIFNLYEVPKFMTVHPLGYQFLCCFDNIVKFYNKLEKDMQYIWNQQYICTAAKYSKSGSLILSCIQETYTTLIIYDSYNFKKIRNVPIPLLKFYATRIQWVQSNSALLLYSINELMKINVYSGQKILQYKDKKDNVTIKCIDYDTCFDLAILGTSANSLMIASKSQEANHSLSSCRNINFPQQISCIKINQGLRVIFFGSKSGVLYWSNYPFKLKNQANKQGIYNNSIQQLSKAKIHNFPITSIDLTSNNKFMLVNIKGQGYFNFRVRKMKNKDSNGININTIFQQLGNPIFNTIDTSCLTNYVSNKQKLKLALEKRKQCFNDLQQFRRQWQAKSAFVSRQIQISTKRDELNFINQTLQKIQKIKQQKKNIQQNIKNTKNLIQSKNIKRQEIYTYEILELYGEVDNQQYILQKTRKQYNQEYQKLLTQCASNLKQIQQDLASKRNNFQNKYRLMLQNMDKFKKRCEFERQQNIQQRKLEKEECLKDLQMRQIQLNTLCYQLSVKITQCKKQYERYCNRKTFLQFKNRFFLQQNQMCKQQKQRLMDLKQKYQSQLKQLQIYTQKKQKKLRVYLTVNQALRKYKQIHTNLTENSMRQTEFIKDQENKLDKNIVQVQKQLSEIAASNEHFQQQILQFENQINKCKELNYKQSLKIKDIGFYLSSILSAIQGIGYCQNQNERTQKLKQIYNNFYVQKKVECILEKQTKSQPNYYKNLLEQKNEKLKNQQVKILNQLKDQKQYVMDNIEVFKNYRKSISEQINLNFLQVQAQNYNLISQCNLRKEQAIVKKKTLNQLVDSMKQAQICLEYIKKQNSTINSRAYKSSTKIVNKVHQVPYVIYQKQKKIKIEQLRSKLSEEGFTNKSIITPTVFRPLSPKRVGNHVNIKKMLQIKAIGQKRQQVIKNRRIQTATNKKVTKSINQDKVSVRIIKPLTATFKKRCQRQTLKSAISSKNKDISKPSTCTTYSKAVFY